MRAIPYSMCTTTEKKSVVMVVVVVDDDFYGGYGAEVISVTEGGERKKKKLTPGPADIIRQTRWGRVIISNKKPPELNATRKCWIESSRQIQETAE